MKINKKKRVVRGRKKKLRARRKDQEEPLDPRWKGKDESGGAWVRQEKKGSGGKEEEYLNLNQRKKHHRTSKKEEG